MYGPAGNYGKYYGYTVANIEQYSDSNVSARMHPRTYTCTKNLCACPSTLAVRLHMCNGEGRGLCGQGCAHARVCASTDDVASCGVAWWHMAHGVWQVLSGAATLHLACVPVHARACMRVCMHVRACVHECMWTCVSACTCVRTCTRVRAWHACVRACVCAAGRASR